MTRPLVPEDLLDRKVRPVVYLYRAGAAFVRSHLTRESPERCARELFGNDPVTELVLRGASAPATTGSPTWAGALAAAVVDDSILAIASVSAAAALIQRGMRVEFGGFASIKIPGRLLDASDAGRWVSEGMPAVVRQQRITAGVTLAPRKLVVIASFSREMIEHSAIESVSRALISEATSLSLDAALFSNATDDGAHPAGILAGITPLTATAGGGQVALVGDIEQLVAALVTAYAGREPLLIMNPIQATKLKLLAGPRFDMPVLQSTSVAPGTVIMVEPSSFVSAFGPTPEFETSKVTTLHYEDTSPQDITGGTPSPAVPARSLFQVDAIALKMRLQAAWGMRAPHVAYLTGATW
jgi:Phage capsid family